MRMKISIGYFLHDTRLWSLTVTQTKMLLTAIWRVSNTVMTISATAISLRLLHSVFTAATVRGNDELYYQDIMSMTPALEHKKVSHFKYHISISPNNTQ